jgi:uncharacterized protein
MQNHHGIIILNIKRGDLFMKRSLLAACLGLVLGGFAASAQAADAPAKKAPIKILLTSGGHAFDQKAFYQLFDHLPGVSYTKAEMPKEADLLKPGLEKKFDALVMYDMNPKLSPAQREAFVALLKQGIGVVALHHNLGANRGWDEYRKIIGGQFIFGDTVIDGQKYTKSPWSHGETLHVTVADKQHPITRGLADFTIHDETYGRFYVAPGVHVLLTTDHPKNNREICWVTKYGKSPVVYLMLGHDGEAYRNPNYAELVGRSIRYVVSK